MDMISRLNAVKVSQGLAVKTIARQTTASAVVMATIDTPIQENHYLELFNELLPHISKFWGYAEDEVAEIVKCSSNEKILKQLVKTWMVDCITYDLNVGRKLRALCFSEFKQKVDSLKNGETKGLPSPAHLMRISSKMDPLVESTVKNQKKPARHLR